MGTLCDLRNQFRGARIAEVHAAPARASGPGGAESSILPWTVARSDRRVDVVDSDPAALVSTDRDAASRLESTRVETMPVRLETTALPAGQTQRSESPNGLGDIEMDALELRFDVRPGRGREPRTDLPGVGSIPVHHGLSSESFSRSSRATISSTVKSWPLPMPGHGVFRFARDQAFSLLTSSGQNGQVRH